MDTPDSPQGQQTTNPNENPQSNFREVDFRELAGDSNEVTITFEEKRYRLILTRNGKLILNR